MKTILLLLVGCLILSTANAQDVPQETKYWVFFKDKVDGAGKVARVEADHLTTAALDRRAKRGMAVYADRDIPLSSSYLDAVRSLNVEPLVQSRWLNAISVMLTADEAQAMLDQPFVKSLRPVGQLQPLSEAIADVSVRAVSGTDIRQSFRLDYGASLGQLEVVNAVPLLEAGLSGAGVKLGIIDTGMSGREATHPSTSTLVMEERFIASEDFTGQSGDGSTHGHSVLSVAAGYDPGQLIGPAYGAEIYHARTEYTPSETNQEEDNFVAGIEWMETQGVDVVNISLGYNEFDDGENSYTIADLDGDTGITTIAADMAVEMGMIVVSSAGNSGCASPTSCWFYITTPADGNHVITVGAVNSSGGLVSFSSRGPTADGRIKPDVMAQGASVYLASTGPYSFSNGTSFSSPMVAGIVALILEANPDVTPTQVADILRDTADRSENPDNEFGWGIVDADAAVQMARDLVATAIEDEIVQENIVLDAPFPNPFVDRTTLLMNNDGPSVSAQLIIYNILGQEVYTAYDGMLSNGRHRIEVDLSGQAPGLYFYRLAAGDVIRSGSLARL
ncbi:MAG: S8 family serine peptidase [Rhodothermales bacterium]